MQYVSTYLRYLILLGLLVLGALNRQALTAQQHRTATLRLRDLHLTQRQILSFRGPAAGPAPAPASLHQAYLYK
ncbi:hypothetical protein SAMN06265337_1532 [Hymenobacter gelipurpurascens]|uniref:Uncharacterized protein n=1 Tax=Hymenobacter gelipurpurascens TaxID=89968 RepID=A0A212TJQ1_9BACT|nr:hypothetical protein [Hymenobacter gelipurpurascens]SNC66203.1 hypothetical protein SAMN06265337_1532 [Hymenobacter gelipurpurascens]